MSSKVGYALLLLTTSACNESQATQTPVSATATVTPVASQAAPVVSARRLVHYDLVLTTTEGTATSRVAFSLDLSDASPGTVVLGKNVTFAGNGRADVGTKVKGRLTMQGDAPRLEVDAEIAALDSTNKLRKVLGQGGSSTPLGTSTVLLDSTDNGIQFRLTGTPTMSAPPESKTAEPPSDTYVLEVTAVHTGQGAPATPTVLTLKLAGDTPAIAKAMESVSLVQGDAGASPRQDVGTRVKATGYARGGSLDLDLDLEWSAMESAVPATRVRKLTSRAAIAAPFDRPTTAFTAEEDGHRYTVTVTPHRAK
jgi:hypothetical protein